MNLSIIIPTYNRKDVLRHTIISLINQDINNYEVIICDDGGTDNTYEEIENIKRQYKLPFELEYCYQEKNGFRAGTARNMGIKKAKADKILFIDQDVLSSPNILKEFCICKNGIFYYGIKKLVSLEFYKDKTDDSILINGMKDFKETFFGHIKATLSSFGCITKFDLDKVGYFDEEFIGYGLEDTELIERLKYNKVEPGFNSACIGYHIEHEKGIISRQSQDIYHYKRKSRNLQ